MVNNRYLFGKYLHVLIIKLSHQLYLFMMIEILMHFLLIECFNVHKDSVV